jgi:MFS family permease
VLGSGGLLLPAGLLSDSFGRRRTFPADMTAFGTALAWAALSAGPAARPTPATGHSAVAL